MRTEARGTSIGETTTNTAADAQNQIPAVESVAAINRASRYSLLAALFVTGLIWDLWSKWSVFHWLNCPGQHAVWKGSLLGIPIDFQLATTFNLGALWGLGQGQTWLFASLSIVAIFVIAYFLWTGQAVESWWLTIASGLLLAGTIGNLYDRLGLHGWNDGQGHTIYGVRDFLDFVFFNGGFHWATFNFADSYLVTGAIILALQSFISPPPQPTT